MGKMSNWWNKNKFSIYDSEEKTVLKLIQKMLNFFTTYSIELDNKTDKYGDHKGSWQGLNRPTLSEEGMRATVENILDNHLHVNPKDFGAKGDGVTDDTESIQEAIDYAYDNNIYTVYFPSGIYNISEPLFLYTYMTVQGENRDSTEIKKINNDFSTKEGYTNVDSIFILTHRDVNKTDEYTRSQAITDITLRGNRTEYVKGNTQHCVYCKIGNPYFLANRYKMYDVDTGVYFTRSWHSEFTNGMMNVYAKAIAIGQESQGIRIMNVNTFGTNEIGVDITGTSYGQINTLNIEFATGTALKLYYGEMIITGLGVENSKNTINKCIHLFNSRVKLYNSFFNVNNLDTTYRTFYLQGSTLEVNNTTVGQELETTSKGRLFELTSKSKISIKDDVNITCTFEENSIIGDDSFNIIEWNDVKQQQNTVFIGDFKKNETMLDRNINPIPQYVSKKITLDNKYNPLLSENGSNRDYSDCYNKGDIAFINNPLKNGHAAYICARNNKKENNILGEITGVNGAVVTMSSLTLDNYETEGGRLYRTIDLVSSSGGTGFVSSINYQTNEIGLGDFKGNWNIGDTVKTVTNNYLRKSDWAVVPIILYGSSTKRPTSPVIGQEYFDLILGKPIWCKQVVPSIVWVDSQGTTV